MFSASNQIASVYQYISKEKLLSNSYVSLTSFQDIQLQKAREYLADFNFKKMASKRGKYEAKCYPHLNHQC